MSSQQDKNKQILVDEANREGEIIESVQSRVNKNTCYAKVHKQKGRS